MVHCCTLKRLFFVLILSSIVVYLLLSWKIVCSNRESQLLLDKLCEDVESGKAVGNLCKVVCSGALKVEDCQTFHLGKEVVFKASLHDSPVYVKGRRANIFDTNEEDIFWRDENGTEHFPSLSEFKNVIRAHFLHNFNISFTQKTFYNIWKQPLKIESFSEDQNKLLLQLSLKTLWSLLQDAEYVTISVFQHLDWFPELFGTCGGLYVVEELKAIEYPSFVASTDRRVFLKNTRIALQILNYLSELETQAEDSFYLCDVKKEHFGLTDSGKIKYLDVDNVYLKPIADRSVGDTPHCNNHSECDFFDCKGICDKIKHQCLPGVTNNNLQNVCEKIFLGTTGSGGLLSSNYASSQLINVVRSCANPSSSKDGTRKLANSTYMINLKSLLTETLSSSTKNSKDTF